MIRGTLLTGERPLYVAAHVIAGLGWRSEIYERPPWSPEDRMSPKTSDCTFANSSPPLAYGERLRRSRKRTLAREQLRAAVDMFEQLGARPWAERARMKLAATGQTLRRRDPTTIDELTPQELRIALQLASGITIREAAAALFLSPRQVNYHLRHVYQKLDIHSREELADALTDQLPPLGLRDAQLPAETRKAPARREAMPPRFWRERQVAGARRRTVERGSARLSNLVRPLSARCECS